MTRETRLKLLEKNDITAGWVLLSKEEADVLQDWIAEAKQSLLLSADLLYRHLPCTCKTHTGLFGGQTFCEHCSAIRDLKALATEPTNVPMDPLPSYTEHQPKKETRDIQGTLFDSEGYPDPRNAVIL
jgi:hypothetical protein